jgi:hypothetical protein
MNSLMRLERIESIFLKWLFCGLWMLGGASALADVPLPEPVPVSMSINQKVSTDLEIILWPDGSASYPVKGLASALDAQAQQANLNHAITLATAGNPDPFIINPQEQTITQNGLPVATLRHPIVFSPNSVFTPNDVFIPQDVAESIFGVQLSYNTASQAVQAKVEYPIKLLIQATSDSDYSGKIGKTEEEDERNAIQPDTTNHALVESIGFTLNSSSYQVIQEQASLGTIRNNNARLLSSLTTLSTDIQGEIGQQPYNFKPTWLYRNGHLGIQKMEGAIRWSNPQYQTRLGITQLGLSSINSPRLEVWGLAMATPNAVSADILTQPLLPLSGNIATSAASSASTPVNIQLKLNGQVIQTRKSIEGHYQFDPVSLRNEDDNVLEVVQLGVDGNSNTALAQKKIPNYTGFLQTGEKATSFFVGRVPLQFNPAIGAVNDSESTTQGVILDQSNKWMAGGRYYYGLTDRLTAGASLVADSIFGKAKTNPFFAYRDIQSANLSGYNSFLRDSNLISGANLSTGLAYRLGHGLSLQLDGGASVIRHFGTTTLQTDNPFSLAGQLALKYKRPHFASTLSLFHYGTDYYTPVMQGINSLYDREGIGLTLQGRQLGFQYQAALERVRLNLSGLVEGGPVWVNHWRTDISRKMTPYTRVSLFLSGTQGESNIGTLNNRNNMLFIDQRLPWGMMLNTGITRTSNRQLFNPFGDSNNILFPVMASEMTQTYYNMNLQVPLPFQLGSISVSTNTGDTIKFAEFRGDFHWRHFVLQPEYRTSLGGDQNFFNLGGGLYYETNHGGRLGIRYLYTFTSNPFSAFGNGSSQTVNHNLTFEFQDILAMIANRPRWIGIRGQSTGFINCFTYLDRNQNNQWDKGEPSLGNIPLKLDSETLVDSNKKGVARLIGIRPALHTVDYDYEKLPITLSPITPPARVKVVAGQQNRVEMGLNMNIGTLSGTISLKDGNGNTLEPTDTVVRLRDTTSDQFIKYTFADKEGHYTMSDVPPGDYEVVIDPEQIKSDLLKILSMPAKVVVPIDFKNFYEKKELNFQLLKVFS